MTGVLETLVEVVRVALGILLVLAAWLGLQAWLRRKSACRGDRDVLDFMLNGCGGCQNGGVCRRRSEEDHHEPART